MDLRRWRAWASSALVVGGTLAVRAAVYVGDNFNADHVGVPSMWHLVDPRLLEANPFAALWDVHTTPPLFNFAVGSVLAWSPLDPAPSFVVLFTAGGVFGSLALFRTLQILGSRTWVAAAVALFVFADPNLIGFEAHVSHEAFVTPMLLGLVWAVAAYAVRPSGRGFGLVLAAGTVLVLTRAMYHPVWLAAVVAVTALVRPPPLPGRRLVAVVALPVVLVGGAMARNEVRFGTFGLSSWAGMNLARTALWPLGDDRLDELVDEGVVSPVAQEKPFSTYASYADDVAPCDPHFGTPALDEPLKEGMLSADIPDVNYNYACFVPVYQQVQRDSLAAIRDDPGAYLEAVRANALLYLSDSAPAGTDLAGLDGRAIRALEAVRAPVELRLHGWAVYPRLTVLDTDVELTLVTGGLLVLAAGSRGVRRVWRREARPVDVVAVVVALTVIYASITGVTADAFENGRFRAPLDPLVYGALLAGVLELASRLVDRRRAPAPSALEPRPEPDASTVGSAPDGLSEAH